MIKKSVLNTKFGWLGLAFCGNKLISLVLPDKSREKTDRIISNELKKYNMPVVQVKNDRFIKNAAEKILSFLEGKNKNINLPVDVSGHRELYRKVWNIARRINYGDTRSYKWIAEKLKNKRMARVVGKALGENPVPLIIPCHRVIKSDGGIGGFSGGLSWKKKLLKMERSGKA